MWRVLPTQAASRTLRSRPVLFYYIMHYYLLIELLSVLASLDPILVEGRARPSLFLSLFGNNCSQRAIRVHQTRIPGRKQIARLLLACMIRR